MRRRGEHGASAIEMAIVAPSFLLLIFAIIEVALWMHARDVALSAAREGVSSLRTVEPGTNEGYMRRYVEAEAEVAAAELGDIQHPRASSLYDAGALRVTVTVEGDVIDLVPGWDLSVSGTASGVVEDFRPDLGED